ncbi:MAG: hypothetical protein JNM84_10045 [Planctomycetes bacterium]|nr:hypothetical protein [Planctomycetota bacterium]
MFFEHSFSIGHVQAVVELEREATLAESPQVDLHSGSDARQPFGIVRYEQAPARPGSAARCCFFEIEPSPTAQDAIAQQELAAARNGTQVFRLLLVDAKQRAKLEDPLELEPVLIL